jgi:hypothetical protein
LFLNEDIEVCEDICIKLTTKRGFNKGSSVTCRFWLNANFIAEEGVGKVNYCMFTDTESLNYKNLMVHDTTQFKFEEQDEYKLMNSNI